MSAPADTIWEAVKVVAFVACILGAAALLVWCSEVHAKPGPYMTVESHTDADYTHAVTREWARHAARTGRPARRRAGRRRGGAWRIRSRSLASRERGAAARLGGAQDRPGGSTRVGISSSWATIQAGSTCPQTGCRSCWRLGSAAGGSRHRPGHHAGRWSGRGGVEWRRKRRHSPWTPTAGARLKRLAYMRRRHRRRTWSGAWRARPGSSTRC